VTDGLGRSGQPFLRPMDIGEILDRTFKLYRTAWKPLILIGLITGIPSILFTGLTQSMNRVDVDAAEGYLIDAFNMAAVGDYTALIFYGAMNFAFLLGLVFLAPLVQAATIAVCARTVLDQPITVGEALRVGARRYWPLLGTYLLSLLLFIVAIPVLLVGGLLIFAILTIPIGLIALTVFLIFSGHAVVIEEVQGGVPALKRSYRLGKGYFWRLLGLGVLFTLMVGVLSIMLNLVPGIMAGVSTAVGFNPLLDWLSTILSGAATIVATPFTFVGLTLVYYDTRMRKEGLDLELAIESQPPPDAQP
jgi:hypothetical protein